MFRDKNIKKSFSDHSSIYKIDIEIQVGKHSYFLLNRENQLSSGTFNTQKKGRYVWVAHVMVNNRKK